MLVTAARSLAFLGQAPFSIEAWVKLPSHANWPRLVRRFALDGSSQRQGYEMYLSANNEFHFIRWHNDAAADGTGTNPVPLDSFNHLVVSCDNKTVVMTLYVNGTVGLKRTLSILFK